ncbi:fatty acyl-AMP ligase [Streptomyces sp. AS02]|uniref:fatty acyl-AMP ligase n=1 Tax=Streptomyces sp. AS02 TaxID=2938946 RepID=UPI002021E3D5|nr:fatty acyl-AMP ligase [Streptomyces sp. AS02]MCL8014925.1 fatty acyl-AMP ligase [Streptomyces sp. AS02]
MVRSLVDFLTTHASRQPDRTAYRFLVTGDSDGETEEISYGRLAERAQAIAAWLQERGLPGARAILLYPAGIDFICGYLGCLAAGVVAVPGVPPRGRKQNHRALTRMKRLIADADATVMMGDREVIDGLADMAEHLPELADITRVATEDIPDVAAASWRDPGLTPDSVAFLQYTSGSTSDPKGVVVTHGNLLDNVRILSERWGHTPDAIERYGHEMYVSWLPVYHDMGLIAPVLDTLHLGTTATLLSPLHFLQRPERWLTAISRFRPHTSGGPNFAYELCLKHATPELVESLDLGDWRVAFNGAEPVRAATLRRFAETFAPAGFRRESLYPCYGLAEATLMVSGGHPDEAPVLAATTAHGPAADTAAVGVGRPGPGLTVVVADPERHVELAEGETGEIWVAGASVARGYWRNVMDTRETFRATVTGHEGRFLRTGDLGFLRDGELFVTGRLKDVIVIDGRNHYPQDLELAAETAHPALRPGCTAAFPVDVVEREERQDVQDVQDGRDGGVTSERIVLVAEAAPEAVAGAEETIARLVRAAIGDAHAVPVHDVVLVRPGTIPKTSSGKIQRRATREAYLRGALAGVAEAAAV